MGDRQRPYQDKHAFISFQIDLRNPNPDFWLLLGEATSKSEHVSKVPLRAETARELYQLYFAKGVAATTAIEGNSLTLDQVKARLEGQLRLPPSLEYQGTEVDNMIAEYRSIMVECTRNLLDRDVTPELIKSVNRGVLKNLDLEDHVSPGEYRRVSVVVGPYLAPPASETEFLVDRLCEWLNGPTFQAPTDALRIPFGFLRAALAHLYIAWIHPFGDGNGRTARLVEFRCLVAAGVPVPAAFVLTSHYNDTRDMYYRQLNNSWKTSDPIPFLGYAVQGWVDRLRDLLDHLHRQVRDLAWWDFLHQQLTKSGQHAEVIERQEKVLIALTQAGATAKEAVRRLTPAVAEAYATKTTKTITRDLNKLESLELVERNDKGLYVASDWRILGFLPVQLNLPELT